MKKALIIGIVLISATIGLTIYSEFINKNVNIHDITNKGLKKENEKVYLDATFIAGTITNDDKNSFYVIFGDGVQYIVYMNNNEASKINKYLLDNPDGSYKIEGITKLIPTSMEENGKKFVKEWLDNNHTHGEENETHSHDITTDEFYHYFGYVYLDSTSHFDLIKILIYVTGTVGLLFIISFINTKYHFI